MRSKICCRVIIGLVAGYDPKFLRYILRKKDYSYVDTNAFYQGIFGTNLIDNYVDGVTLITYNLATLTSGVRYYYLIMGANANDSARTLSRIGSFIAP